MTIPLVIASTVIAGVVFINRSFHFGSGAPSIRNPALCLRCEFFRQSPTEGRTGCIRWPDHRAVVTSWAGVNSVREPDAVAPHVRLDEKGIRDMSDAAIRHRPA